MMISIIKSKSHLKKIIQKIAAAAFWLSIWEIIYLAVRQEILIVSPIRVAQRLFELLHENTFWLTIFQSMLHVLSGFLLGIVAGVLLAVWSSAFSVFYDLFYPIISIVKAVPVVSFIILALVWIKSSYLPVFISFLVVLPIVWSNVTKGIAKTDCRLLQLAQSYRFGVIKTIRYVYVPFVMPYFFASCTTGMGLAWKAGIAAEVLANTKFSIGGRIYDSKIYMETADTFAWTIIVVLLSVVLEKIMTAFMNRAELKYNGHKGESL